MPVNNKIKKPRITVFVPAYNEEKLIAQTLNCLKNQDIHEDYELLVVDNASTDKTAQIAKNSGARVVSEPQKGNRFAVERGFAEARGDIVIQTDADTRPDKSFIRKIAQEYDDPKVVGVGTRIKFFDAEPWVNPTFKFMTIFNFRESMWGASLSARKDAWRKVGGFNHGFDLNSDAYFTIRLRKIGKVVIIKDYYLEMSGRRFCGNIVDVAQNSKDLFLNGTYMMFTGKPISKKPFKDIR
ncbi:MAG: glycosyltransferase family 2 protein [Candidatus Dojkabacteria bacterium]|uniref:Glucosyl-3-phosphoglycerate synthase n=2 Tax=Candidatus Dojkabacteria TaxID=74243 RepID=A0A136KFR6_9BACT|nr:MAG: Glucosyl-3-phosphoglycerate synthase [candidate division WS6 bacterium OLB21]MBW7953337.1 glycosyltransferase family 2 protein [Candidatus Dojkabacteria bacterium]WKZ27543.1 MAG: glycosyltransferase family 2 protein [Candidatus Dojkabacteria bacterium]